MEDFARPRRRVRVVGEADDLARGLEQEAQGRVVLAPFEMGRGVALGLSFRRGQVFARAVLLGFDYACRMAVNEQHVVGRTAVGGIFPHGHTDACRQIELLHVLDDPAGLLQLLVNLLACLGFRRHAAFFPPLHFIFVRSLFSARQSSRGGL